MRIARGVPAITAGYERPAGGQGEDLWLAEAAHLPVNWATQVLETLARTGQLTRAEIAGAAMSERAECPLTAAPAPRRGAPRSTDRRD